VSATRALPRAPAPCCTLAKKPPSHRRGAKGGPSEIQGGYTPCAGNENVGWNRRPFIREKILAKNETATYRQQFVCRYIAGCLSGFATSRPMPAFCSLPDVSDSREYEKRARNSNPAGLGTRRGGAGPLRGLEAQRDRPASNPHYYGRRPVLYGRQTRTVAGVTSLGLLTRVRCAGNLNDHRLNSPSHALSRRTAMLTAITERRRRDEG
jgi:hypothetical protein